MKKKYQSISANEVLYKTEELLDAASNRYKITIQVANRAKRRRYEDIDLLEDLRTKPIIRAILEMADEISQPEIISDWHKNKQNYVFLNLILPSVIKLENNIEFE